MSSSKKFTYKGTLGQVFIRFIDWWYSQSCWYFRPGFVNVAPLTFSLVSSSPPPLPYVNEFTEYTYTVCKGGYGFRGGEGQTDKHLPQSPFAGQDSEERGANLFHVVLRRVQCARLRPLPLTDLLLVIPNFLPALLYFQQVKRCENVRYAFTNKENQRNTRERLETDGPCWLSNWGQGGSKMKGVLP